MSTSSQTLSSPLRALAHDHRAPGALGRVRDALMDFTCHVRGHAPQLQVDEGRMFLFCADCRRVSQGWRLDAARPRLRHPGDPARFERYAWLTGATVAGGADAGR